MRPLLIRMRTVFLSVRSTNVYEEQSLGVYPTETLHTWADSNTSEHRIAIWGKYLMRHARRQLSFGQSDVCTRRSSDPNAQVCRHVVARVITFSDQYHRGPYMASVASLLKPQANSSFLFSVRVYLILANRHG